MDDKTLIRRFYPPDETFACTSDSIFTVDLLEQMTSLIVNCAAEFTNLSQSYNEYNKLEGGKSLLKSVFGKVKTF